MWRITMLTWSTAPIIARVSTDSGNDRDNPMRDLRREMNLSMLFVSHNLAVVEYMADRVAVMYLGKIVEIAATDLLFAAPAHPYTRALFSAVPDVDPDIAEPPMHLEGDVPSPLRIPSGCRFRTRCPLASQRCAIEEPELREVRPGQIVACHAVESNDEGNQPNFSRPLSVVN